MVLLNEVFFCLSAYKKSQNLAENEEKKITQKKNSSGEVVQNLIFTLKNFLCSNVLDVGRSDDERAFVINISAVGSRKLN